MLKDQSLLRRLTWERLRGLDERGVSVVELGGKKDGAHARLFRGKGCEYLALGFEGDVFFDLRTGHSSLEAASADVVLISMVLMYLNGEAETSAALSEAHRILKPGGRLYLFEPFLYADTPHASIADRSRWSADEMRSLLLRRGFENVTVEKLGGLCGMLCTVVRDLLPGFLSPLRAACTIAGAASDRSLARVPYFRRRNAAWYAGHFTTAHKPAHQAAAKA
jgi:SAM-dependent methyltransferase